jgi:hypothetical protein
MTESSFFFVERYNGTEWIAYRSDGDWDTKFIWKPKLSNPTESVITIEWGLDHLVDDGKYRILYQAYAPTLFGGYTKFYTGQSSPFMVL